MDPQSIITQVKKEGDSEEAADVAVEAANQKGGRRNTNCSSPYYVVLVSDDGTNFHPRAARTRVRHLRCLRQHSRSRNLSYQNSIRQISIKNVSSSTSMKPLSILPLNPS